MSCTPFEDQLSSYLDRELGSQERSGLEVHLGSCADCRRTLEALQAQSRELESAFAPLQAGTDALARRIVTVLRAEPAPVLPFRWFPLAVAAAAGFLLAAGLFLAWPSGPPAPPPDQTAESLKRLTDQLKEEHLACQKLERQVAAAGKVEEALRKERSLRDDLEKKLSRSASLGEDLKSAQEARADLDRRLAESEARIGALTRELATKTPPAQKTPGPPPGSIATLETRIGTVEVLKGNEWEDLAPGQSLSAGAWVRTPPESKATFSCPDGTEIRMNAVTEAQWTEPRALRLREGEIYARLAGAPKPFLFRTTDGTFEASEGAFDLTHSVQTAPMKGKAPPKTLTALAVLDGQAQFAQGKSSQVIPASAACQVTGGVFSPPQPVDPILRSRWIHELLRPGKDDPEIDRRVVGMLVRMGQTKTPEEFEIEIRALGDRASGALLRAIRAPAPEMDAYHRREAARLLGDLAGAYRVPDLVALLEDPDREIRESAEKGLERLTGRKLKSAEEWADWYRTYGPVWGRAPEASKKTPLK
jgi:ferric-dicitrate binding protein FerR (iron transport regulator)